MRDLNKQQAIENFEHAIEHHKPTFDDFFLGKLFGFSFSYGEETCRVDLVSKDFMFNPMGTLHGGIIALILDASMGHLCKHFLGTSVTVEMKTQFLRPVRTGPIYCEARFQKKGSKIISVESYLYNENGQLAAIGTATWYKID